jgi:hypothetical protein
VGEADTDASPQQGHAQAQVLRVRSTV